MKLLAVRTARSIWLVPSYYFNPKGLFMRPAIEAVKARYNFLKSPLDFPTPPPSNEGYKYESGVFNSKSGRVMIVHMTIHGDGVVVETRSSTEDGDSFLEDVTSWVSKEYGLPSHTDLPIRRIYASELNVSYSKPPTIFNPKIAPLINEISSAIGDERKGKADFLSLQLSTDQTRSTQPAIFKFEREINVAFEENRFYSFAPIQTDPHIKLLEKLEMLAV